MMSYLIKSPLPVEEGGTEKQSFTAHTVICGGTTSTGPLQNVSGTGSANQALTSQGAASLPTWSNLSNETFFELLSSDPSDPAVGQVWYNTSTDLFKGAIDGGSTSTWSAKTSMNTARRALAGAGDIDDALSFGGINTSNTVLGTTEKYTLVGDSWTAKTAMNTSRGDLGGCGTADDALSFGGTTSATDPVAVSAVTEQYSLSGDTWTNKNTLNTARYKLSGCGTVSDALCFGGAETAPTRSAVTERWNGTSWSTQANLNFARADLGGAGMASTAFAFGGTTTSSITRANAQYDGSGDIWNTRANMNIDQQQMGTSGANGSGALSFGGNGSTAELNNTEEYNSVSNTWSSKDTLNTSRRLLAGCGTLTDALAFGGYIGTTASAVTEAYTGSAAPTIVTFTIA